jgi:hypothetical protein
MAFNSQNMHARFYEDRLFGSVGRWNRVSKCTFFPLQKEGIVKLTSGIKNIVMHLQKYLHWTCESSLIRQFEKHLCSFMCRLFMCDGRTDSLVSLFLIQCVLKVLVHFSTNKQHCHPVT